MAMKTAAQRSRSAKKAISTMRREHGNGYFSKLAKQAWKTRRAK